VLSVALQNLALYFSKILNIPVLDFVLLLPAYLFLRFRQASVFALAGVEVFFMSFSEVKQQVVRRMFWGRGSLYKGSFHIVIIAFTVILLVTGIYTRFGVTEAHESLEVNYGIIGNYDLLEQGASLNTVLAIEDVNQVNYSVRRHTVQGSDSLDSIAAQYGVSKDTVKWANDRILSPFNDNIQSGWELLIPEIDGVLYSVKAGQDVDAIAEVTGGTRFDIIELNNLVPPHYGLAEGQKVFVPGGRITPPSYYVPGLGGYVSSGVYVNAALGELPAGTFDDPLTSPLCGGYRWERGFTPGWHDGVDLSHGECPVRAAAAGKVVASGNDGGFGGGNRIVIDHGGGVRTLYLHGSVLWVKTGDYVQKGQDIMLMGCTGNCTGTHLHFTLSYNGQSIDPAPYVPYARP
jgi:murein DD-endopeptidase MepM/ murein hydrolase activator NlpD